MFLDTNHAKTFLWHLLDSVNTILHELVLYYKHLWTSLFISWVPVNKLSQARCKITQLSPQLTISFFLSFSSHLFIYFMYLFVTYLLLLTMKPPPPPISNNFYKEYLFELFHVLMIIRLFICFFPVHISVKQRRSVTWDEPNSFSQWNRTKTVKIYWDFVHKWKIYHNKFI